VGCGWFIQYDHSSVLHRPLNRQFELFKGTEENQDVYYAIRAGFVGSVLRKSSILWLQNTCEEKLGTGIPAVLHGDIVSILFNAERIGRAGITFFLKIILENVFLENAFSKITDFLRKSTHFLRKWIWEIFPLGAGP
jgi:hypothetical protein